MKTFARGNSLLSIIFSCFSFFFFLLIDTFIKAGAINDTSFKPSSTLATLIIVALVTLVIVFAVVILSFMDIVDNGASFAYALILLILSALALVGGIGSTILCYFVVRASTGLFVTVGWISFLFSALFVISALINFCCVMAIFKEQLLPILKPFARFNAVLCIVFSCLPIFFFVLFGIIVNRGMEYTGEERPVPHLFVFAIIALIIALVALLHLGCLDRKPKKAYGVVVTILSFVLAAGALAASIYFSLILNVKAGLFVTVGWIEFISSLPYVITSIINGVCLPLLIKNNLLFD